MISNNLNHLLWSKVQQIILPIGFVFIIIMMITTAFLTTTQIETTNNVFINNGIEQHQKEDLINEMQFNKIQYAYKLNKMALSRDPFDIDELKLELSQIAVNFITAREDYVLSGLTPYEKNILSTQSKLADVYFVSVNKIIELLQEESYAQAMAILDDKITPLTEEVIELIYQLRESVETTALNKVIEAKEMSSKATNRILGLNSISIFISFILMLYLIFRQRERDADLSLLASTDCLTELANRDNFIESIDKTILKEPDSGFSIIFIDVDYFKNINDNFGHEVGDEVLKLFSSTIKNLISPVDILSRFGGDEFALLLKNKIETTNNSSFAKRLSIALDTSYMINNNEVFVSASIGVSSYPNDGKTSKKLLKNADVAMYSAKQSGRNCHQFFSLEYNQQLDHEHALSHALQTVLKNKNSDNQLSLVYQPLINIDDESFYECEALIRWKNNDGDLINTAEFIEAAENHNLIGKLNEFVIEEACKQQNLWQKQGITDVRININLSGNKRVFNRLLKVFTRNLKRYNLLPELFGIELTERTMHEITDETYNELDHFRSLGMKIAIDDFGTGYSSLSYLKDLPITSIKIDGAFIKGVPQDKINVAIVKAIITLAHSLDFDVIAECVETQEQLDFLKICKCNIAQGYLYHRPLNSEGISQLKLVA